MFMSHIASNSQVFEVSKILFTVFMMSQVQWTAVENVENVVFMLKQEEHRN